MKYKLHIIRKPVKYFRLKVIDEKTLQATAPTKMSQDDIMKYVKQKETRIVKQLTKIAKAREAFLVEKNQILLHGEAYTIMYREWQGKQFTLDHKTKHVRRGFDLKDDALQLHWYKTYAKQYLTQRLKTIAESHGLQYNKCYIRDQKTKRWTCSSQRNIGLNRKLIKAPIRIMDYVINHELAHLTHMNHSQSFRDHCEVLFPKTKEARVWMRQYGNALK